MDDATREGRPAVSAAGDETVGEPKSPAELRREIEQTREELGDAVQALAEETDLQARARDRIAVVKDTAQGKKDEFVFTARHATPDSASAGARQFTSRIQQEPVRFAAGGAFAAGLLLGWLLGRR